jgi:hypothetical protein
VLVPDSATGRERVDVVTPTAPTARRYVAPADDRDYRLWLARNMGGGYSSVFHHVLTAPGAARPPSPARAPAAPGARR